jgi:hypothetical protein
MTHHVTLKCDFGAMRQRQCAITYSITSVAEEERFRDFQTDRFGACRIDDELKYPANGAGPFRTTRQIATVRLKSGFIENTR